MASNSEREKTDRDTQQEGVMGERDAKRFTEKIAEDKRKKGEVRARKARGRKPPPSPAEQHKKKVNKQTREILRKREAFIRTMNLRLGEKTYKELSKGRRLKDKLYLTQEFFEANGHELHEALGQPPKGNRSSTRKNGSRSVRTLQGGHVENGKRG